MDRNEFRLQQFVALRREVDGQQWRLFLTVVFGLTVMPLLSYFLLNADTHVWLILPPLLLVLILLYLVQQNEMMRVGRFIREQLEPEGDLGLGWETWLESRAEFRDMESRFSGAFIVIFFLYFALALGIAVYRLIVEAATDPSGNFWFVVYGAIAAYAFITIWAVATVISHWRSSVRTTPAGK